MKTYIYDLSDPRTGQVRYVGKSVDPKERLATHIREARQGSVVHSRRWIDGLLKAGLRPVLGVLEETDKEQADECERYWIATLKFLGADLTNRTPGGDGQPPGYQPSAEARAKISAATRGRKMPAEQKARLKEALQRPEIKARRSELMKQRYADPVARDAITGPTKGMRLSEDTKRRMSASWTPERKAKHIADKSALPVDERWKSQLDAARKARWEKWREEGRTKEVGASLLAGRKKAAAARRSRA